jgi:hypothetical protein
MYTFALLAIQPIAPLAIETEYLFTHFTEKGIFAVVAEWLVALATDEHILAVETMYTFAFLAMQPIAPLAIKAECHVAHFTVEAIFAFIAEFFLAHGALFCIHALVAF